MSEGEGVMSEGEGVRSEGEGVRSEGEGVMSFSFLPCRLSMDLLPMIVGSGFFRVLRVSTAAASFLGYIFCEEARGPDRTWHGEGSACLMQG